MSQDKELTKIIVFLWVIAIILFMSFAGPLQPHDGNYQKLRNEEENTIKKEASVIVNVDEGGQEDRTVKKEASVTVHVLGDKESSFCGSSTKGSCTSDSGCVEAGCSGQICQSKSEESMVSTCEWKECYDNEKYGLSCQCVNNQCQWK